MSSPSVDTEHARLAEIARLSDAAANDPDVAFLVDCLGQPRKVVQRRAAEALAQAAARGVPVTTALHAALDDANAARRWGAAYAFSLLGPPPAVTLPALLEALGSDDGDVRWAAAEILKRMGAATTSSLLHLTSDGNAAQRKMALYCLRDLRVSAPEIEVAVQRATADADVGVRLAALAALPLLVSEPRVAAECVLRLTDDPDPGVRRAAVTALGVLGQRTAAIESVVRQASESADPGLRRAAERAIRLLDVGRVSASKAER